MPSCAGLAGSRKTSVPVTGGGLLFALLLSTLSAGVASAAQPAGTDASIRVEYRDGLLTLRARNAPLVSLVEAIGDEAGYLTRVFGVVDRKVTRSMDAVPLQRALKQLLDGTSNAIRFDETRTPGVSQVLLFGDATSPAENDFLPSAEPDISPISGDLDRDLAGDMAAIRARADGGDADAVTELVELLRQSPDPAVRAEAARMLGELDDAVAIDALVEGVNDEDRQVRFRAIRALAAVSGDQATQVLAEAMLNHDDIRTRLLAAWGLGRQPGELARSYLEAAIDDGDELIRQAVTRALADGGADPLTGN